MARASRMALLAAVAIALAACAERRSLPTWQYLTFDYTWPSVSRGAHEAIAEALRTGAMEVTDVRLAGAGECSYIANFDPALDEPKLIHNGVPGQGGFNIRISGENELPLSSPCGAIGPTAKNIVLLSGQGLAIGPVMQDGGAEIFFFDAATGAVPNFTTDDLYFAIRIDSVDPANDDHTIGEFEFIAHDANDPADARLLVVRNGRFAMKPD